MTTSVFLYLYAGPRNLSRSFSRHLRCRSVVDFVRFSTLDRGVAAFGDAFVGGDDDGVDDVASEIRGGDFRHLSVALLDGEDDADDDSDENDEEDDDEEDDDDEDVDLFRFRTQDDSSCLYKYDFSANDLPQRVQVCGFVFEWV